MRLAFGTVPADPHPATVELIREAEAMGYDTAWLPDQTFNRDPFLVLATAALATSRIRFGVGIVNPFTRHPTVIARLGATLDEVSGGRFTLGVGAGNRQELLDRLGYDTKAAQRCRELVLLCRGLWAGERVTLASDTVTVREVELETPPRPAIPIYLAARGPMIMRTAGELADGVIIGALASDDGLTYALDLVAQGAAAAGRARERIDVVSWVNCIVTDRKPEVVDKIRPMVAHVIGGAPPVVLRAIGMDDALIGRIKDAYATGGPRGAAPLVPDAVADKLALVGDPAYLAERIRALARVGVGMLAVLMPSRQRSGSHGVGAFDHLSNMRRIVDEVMPRV